MVRQAGKYVDARIVTMTLPVLCSRTREIGSTSVITALSRSSAFPKSLTEKLLTPTRRNGNADVVVKDAQLRAEEMTRSLRGSVKKEEAANAHGAMRTLLVSCLAPGSVMIVELSLRQCRSRAAFKSSRALGYVIVAAEDAE